MSISCQQQENLRQSNPGRQQKSQCLSIETFSSQATVHQSVRVEQCRLRVSLSDLLVLPDQHPPHHPRSSCAGDAECRRTGHRNNVARRIALWPQVLQNQNCQQACRLLKLQHWEVKKAYRGPDEADTGTRVDNRKGRGSLFFRLPARAPTQPPELVIALLKVLGAAHGVCRRDMSQDPRNN